MFRRLLLSATALVAVAGATLAADLPYQEAPSGYAPIFTWTGLYLGGQIGYAWGTDSFSGHSGGFAFSGPSFVPNGVVGGAHIGYNYQINQFVVGLEGDIDGSGVSRSYGWGPVVYGTQIPVDGSIRGRVGFALDRAMFYVAGGAAFASVTNSYTSFFGYNSFAKSLAGWTIGGGLEYAITNNWSIRAEYRYSDYGSFTDFPLLAVPNGAVSHHETENAIRAGFSYKFDSLFAPSTAKY
ncbi:MAG: outer membrane protein [Methylocella sp.]